MPNITNWMFEQIQSDIAALQQQVREIVQKSERGETSGGFQSFAYANRPLAATGGMQANNQQYADTGFCYDCRKSGEGAGLGTGVPCYYSPTDNDWRRFEDNAIVAN